MNKEKRLSEEELIALPKISKPTDEVPDNLSPSADYKLADKISKEFIDLTHEESFWNSVWKKRTRVLIGIKKDEKEIVVEIKTMEDLAQTRESVLSLEIRDANNNMIYYTDKKRNQPIGDLAVILKEIDERKKLEIN